MVAFSRIYEGQTLYDYHRYKTPIKGISQMGEWMVKVLQIDTEKRKALCSWNKNSPTWYSERSLLKLKVKKVESEAMTIKTVKECPTCGVDRDVLKECLLESPDVDGLESQNHAMGRRILSSCPECREWAKKEVIMPKGQRGYHGPPSKAGKATSIALNAQTKGLDSKADKKQDSKGKK